MRHVIFPVFLADAEEARLLAELTRLGLGLGLAASLAAELAGAFRVVVASDSATVCAEARALGVEAQLLPGPQPEHAVLPRGLLAA
ncbi:MAG: hypothetical protein Q7I92_14800, partial [Humidesulfovibrio sp.]|nr:hypothetical protein [Humidesulfovibrio sp.]